MYIILFHQQPFVIEMSKGAGCVRDGGLEAIRALYGGCVFVGTPQRQSIGGYLEWGGYAI